MILPNTDGDEACRVAERIRSQVAELQPGWSLPRAQAEAGVEADAARIAVTISVGVASFPDAGARQGRRHRGRRRGPADRQGARSQPGLHGSRDGDADRGRCLTTDRHAAGVAGPAFRHHARSGRRRGDARWPPPCTSSRPAAGSGPSSSAPTSSNGDSDGRPLPAVGRLFEALLYGTERWDGRGYPEGLRGEAHPGGGARLRGAAGVRRGRERAPSRRCGRAPARNSTRAWSTAFSPSWPKRRSPGRRCASAKAAAVGRARR